MLKSGSFFLSPHLEEIPYSQFKTWIEQDKIAEVSITHSQIEGKLKPEMKWWNF